jgi:hypothetical protein
MSRADVISLGGESLNASNVFSSTAISALDRY